MPVEPDAVIWKALLGACRTYSNVEFGELAAKEVLKLESKDAGAYVLLSNIYVAAGKWDKVSSVRSTMLARGVWKEPGRSWIEVDNKIHEFVVGDTSHPEAMATYNELQNLTKKLKAKGFIPDKKLVLQNISEEDKELAICSHSEKLAIAYGILHIPRGMCRTNSCIEEPSGVFRLPCSNHGHLRRDYSHGCDSLSPLQRRRVLLVIIDDQIEDQESRSVLYVGR